MNNNIGHIHADELKDAFQVFNQLSVQLAASYHLLEAQVSHLTAELAAARHERLQQLIEKERLANRLEGLLAALPAGVVVVNQFGVVAQFNPTALAILGEPLQDQAWSEIVNRVYVDPNNQSPENEFKNGRYVSVHISPLTSEPSSIVLLKDVTENTLLQIKVSRQARLTAMGEMTAGLAHQIRTPLAAALLHVSHLANQDLSNSDRQRFVEKAISRLRYLERTVTDMLVFARGGPIEMREINLQHLITELHIQIEEPLLARHGRLEVIGHASDITIKGSYDALLNALANLIINALDVSIQNPTLQLQVSVQEDWIVLALSDNGPGIPDSIKDRIFDPFFTTRPNGVGLGLAVVREIILAHHGHIRVTSQLEVGTTFAIHLPIVRNLDIKKQTQGRFNELSKSNLTSCTGVVI